MQKSCSILVIDDNPADLLIIQEAFEQCGYVCHVKLTASLAEAERALGLEPFDLLVSDFGIELDEHSFVSALRSTYPQMPVVILSGSYNSKAAYQAGANAFIHKPCGLQEFIDKIRGLMQFWIEVAQLPSRPAAGTRRS